MNDFGNDFKKDSREKERKGNFDGGNDGTMIVTERLRNPYHKGPMRCQIDWKINSTA
jgi:hypothetical protein